MNWLLTTLLCAVLVELLLRLPFSAPVRAVARSGQRAMRVVASKAISDHWKEKAMAAYARQTFVSSLRIAVLLAIVLGVATALVLGLEQLSGGFQAFFLSGTGIAFSIVAASAYAWARRVALSR